MLSLTFKQLVTKYRSNVKSRQANSSTVHIRSRQSSFNIHPDTAHLWISILINQLSQIEKQIQH